MSDRLTRNQKKAVRALLEYPRIDQAAAEVGVNPKTITRWMDQEQFKRALGQAEGEKIDKVARRLVTLGDKALDALESVLDNPAQRGASNKRLAAQAILDNLMKLRELASLESRLSELEKAVLHGKR